jgi:hypothetical protein
MAILEALKLIDFNALTPEQRNNINAVRQRLQERKAELEKALDAVNRGLDEIERKSSPR